MACRTEQAYEAPSSSIKAVCLLPLAFLTFVHQTLCCEGLVTDFFPSSVHSQQHTELESLFSSTTLFLPEREIKHPSWFQGPSILHASSFQNIPVWCEVKLCKILFERKEQKRKELVKMHLLDHVLNEVQLKVVFVQRKEKPLQIRRAPRERASFVVALTLKCNFSWLFGLENGGGDGERWVCDYFP